MTKTIMTPTQNKTVVIGDVHGSYSVLLETIEPYLDTGVELVFLGDLFDRAPEPDGDLKVLKFVYDMEQHPEKYGLSNVEVLMGNHESMIVKAMDTLNFSHWIHNGGDFDFATYLVDQPHYIYWLRNRPLYLIRDNYLLVHAGVKCGVPLEEQQAQDLMWIREDPHKPHLLPYKVVYGHTIHEKVTDYGDKVAVDTGAYFTDKLSTFTLV